KLLVDLGLGSTEPVAARGPERGQVVEGAPRELLVALLAAHQAPTSGAPEDCDVLRVVAGGSREGHPVRLGEGMVVRPYKPWRVSAGDIDTGVPLAIAGILLASGDAKMTGAHGAERIFAPDEFLVELARYSMRASETTTRVVGHSGAKNSRFTLGAEAPRAGRRAQPTGY